MRDPARIRPLLTKLAALWEAHPDLRLGQLISCLNPSVPPVSGAKDIFYVEDDLLEKQIDIKIKNWG